MVIECKHVWDYISDYLDNSLSSATREVVQRHLEHCEICSAILDSTRNILVLTADSRVFELPVGFSERLHARLAQEIHGIAGEPRQDSPD
jgi:predicted anti-sigma-YlaC factor YlaD